MRLLYFIKMTLKGLKSNILVTAIFFLAFPIILAFIMGVAKDLSHTSPIDIKETKINIEDRDNSKMSKELIKYLENDNLKDFFKIDSEAKSSLIIEKGYEKELLDLKGGSLIINQKENQDNYGVNILKSILDKYHENIYATLKNDRGQVINNIDNSTIIKSNIIQKRDNKSLYKETIVSMIGFLVGMLIYNLIKGNNTDLGQNISKRIISFPITRSRLYIYESVSSFIYVFIILSIYVFFFRFAGIAFNGNLLDLLILILVGTFLVVSVESVLLSLFGKKFSNIIGAGIFLLSVFAGKAFGEIGSSVGLISPTEYLDKSFIQYNLNGNIGGCEKWVGIILIVSIILFLIGLVKEKFNERRVI